MPTLETESLKGFLELFAIGIAVGILLVVGDLLLGTVSQATGLPLAA